MSVGATIALGALIGLVLGVLVSLATDVPLAPETGLAIGALVGWRVRRERDDVASRTGRSSRSRPGAASGERAAGSLTSAPGGGGTGPSSSGSPVATILVQPAFQVLAHRVELGIAGQVAQLTRVGEQVVELLARTLAPAPARRHEQVLGRSVDVGQHRLEAVAEAPDQLVPLGADRPLGVVGDVVGQLGEELVAHLGGLPAREGQQRRPARPSGRGAPASSQSVGYRSTWETSALATRPPANPAGPRMMSSTPSPRSVSVAFAPGTGSPVVGRQDHGVLGEAELVQRTQHRADAPVSERADTGVERGHVRARLRRVGQVRGRRDVERVARLELGRKNSRWVSSVDRKNGCGGRPCSSFREAGAMACACVVATSTTWS